MVLATLALLSGAVAPSAGYEPMSVSDGGTIKGRVTYQGAIPTRKIIPTKDREVCGAIRDEPQIVVGPDGGVRDVVVLLKDVGKGKPWPKLAKPPELINRECVFVPHVQAIRVGGDVVVVNSDPVLHNTHSFYGRLTIFNLALPNKGQRITKSVSRRPGVMRVECDAHGWMLAWIYVTENPYSAVTGDNGTFVISDVPPGTYTLVAWQAHTGPVEMKVSVEAKEVTEVPIQLKTQ